MTHVKMTAPPKLLWRIQFIKYNIEVFGGIVGSAIVFPIAGVALAATTMAGMLKSVFGKSNSMDAELTIAIMVSVLTMIGALSSIGFTAINYARPENSLRKLTGFLVLATGILSVISAIYLSVQNFHWMLIILLLGGAGVLVSGLYQSNLIKSA